MIRFEPCDREVSRGGSICFGKDGERDSHKGNVGASGDHADGAVRGNQKPLGGGYERDGSFGAPLCGLLRTTEVGWKCVLLLVILRVVLKARSRRIRILGDGSFDSPAHKLLSACPRQAGIRRFAALCSTPGGRLWVRAIRESPLRENVGASIARPRAPNGRPYRAWRKNGGLWRRESNLHFMSRFTRRW